MVHKLGYGKTIVNFVDGMLQKLDRTAEPHKFKFDIDIKTQLPSEYQTNVKSSSKDAWVYHGSTNSVEEAENKIKEKSLLSKGGNVRIVEANTGKIIKML